MSYLRYRRDIDEGVRFATIRYPWHHNVTPQQAETIRQAMPHPDKFEIVEDD